MCKFSNFFSKVLIFFSIKKNYLEKDCQFFYIKKIEKEQQYQGSMLHI